MLFKKLITIAFLIAGFSALSQEVSFTAEVNKNPVSVNQHFQITYTIENADGKNFSPPSLEDFHVLSGPNHSSSFQWVNGKSSRSESFSYILQPRKTGEFILPPATYQVKNRTIKSNPLTIEVIKSNNGTSKRNSGGSGNPGSAADIDDNVFLRVYLNKDKVYQGEQVTAVYKIYTRLNIVNYLISKMPNYTGFWMQDFDIPHQLTTSTEIINGMKYQVATVKKTALFPQHSGKMAIEPLEMEIIARIKEENRGNGFFRLFGNYRDIKHVITSNSKTITVNPLPEKEKPADFSGAVGRHFEMNINLSDTQVTAGDPVTLKAEISGQGNIKLIDPPELSFPPRFEVYDPKVKENIRASGSSVKGSKLFEYLIIPQVKGEYKLPEITFSYFDIDKESYQTISYPQEKIHVLKGKGGAGYAAGKEDVELIGKDIRYIHTDDVTLHEKGKRFFASPGFYIWLGVPFILFFGLIYMRKKQQSLKDDPVLLRKKKATKVARKHLSISKKHMHSENKKQFYDETSRAIWGYLADKFNIEYAGLSREMIRRKLKEKNIEEELIAETENLIDTCELELFAPSENGSTMERTYEKAVYLITNLEKQIG